MELRDHPHLGGRGSMGAEKAEAAVRWRTEGAACGSWWRDEMERGVVARASETTGEEGQAEVFRLKDGGQLLFLRNQFK